ncbi:hypothetical protein ACFL24_02325 [Patescibacteria group bacterium]
MNGVTITISSLLYSTLLLPLKEEQGRKRRRKIGRRNSLEYLQEPPSLIIESLNLGGFLPLFLDIMFEEALLTEIEEISQTRIINRILLIEDEPTGLVTIYKILTEAGYNNVKIV